jgi:hypothetical protein
MRTHRNLSLRLVEFRIFVRAPSDLLFREGIKGPLSPAPIEPVGTVPMEEVEDAVPKYFAKPSLSVVVLLRAPAPAVVVEMGHLNQRLEGGRGPFTVTPGRAV